MNRPCKMMIVDNDADTLALWRMIHDNRDAIWILRGGMSAQRELRKIDYEIDAVITDLAMDDIDGITLTEHIRRNERIREKENQCLIFWFTGFPVTKTLENLKADLNVTEIFLKPMDPQSLIERVKGYLAINGREAAAA